MILTDDQMQRQVGYETASYYLARLLDMGLIKPSEYAEELAGTVEKYRPVIEHSSLLYKE